jgi:hypothetical protein
VNTVLFGKPVQMRALRRPRHTWACNIKMDLEERGCDGFDWIQLVQDTIQWQTLLNTVINPRIP